LPFAFCLLLFSSCFLLLASCFLLLASCVAGIRVPQTLFFREPDLMNIRP
jgi:hypothetical protein